MNSLTFYKGVKQAPSIPRPLGEGQGEGLTWRTIAARSPGCIKQLDAARKEAVEQLKQAAYFHRQVVWLQDRFPEAKLADVPGLVKLVDRKEIEAADWSLTPGRYVGVAPAEQDEDFDFEAALRDIHVELAEPERGSRRNWRRRFRRTSRSWGYEVA